MDFQYSLFLSSFSLFMLVFSHYIKGMRLFIPLAFIMLYTAVVMGGISAENLFMSSQDFRTNMYILEVADFNADMQFMKIALRFLANKIGSTEALIAAWSLVPCLIAWYLIVMTRAFGKFVFKGYCARLSVSLIFSSVAFLFLTRGFFNQLPIFSADGLPTAHLLMQSVGVSFLLPFVYYYNKYKSISVASAICAMAFHPVNALYILVSTRRVWSWIRNISFFKRDKIFGISLFLWLLALPLLALTPFLLNIFYSFYVGIRGSSISGLQEITMGVAGSNFVLSAIILISITGLSFIYIATVLRRRLFKLNTTQHYSSMKIIAFQTAGFSRLIFLSILMGLVSITISPISQGFAYRLLYFAYIFSPIYVASIMFSLILLLKSRMVARN